MSQLPNLNLNENMNITYQNRRKHLNDWMKNVALINNCKVKIQKTIINNYK